MRSMLFLVIFLLLTNCGCGSISINFLASDSEEYKFYFGNLHSHTKYSDGQGSPSDAFHFAKYEVGYDYYAITDHAEFLNASKWQDIGKQAEIYTENGEFVGLRGFEYTNYFLGHFNVFNTKDYIGYFSANRLYQFYNWIEVQDNALVQINHPNMVNAPKLLDFYESVKNQVFAIETGNKLENNSSEVHTPYFDIALKNGWVLAPANNMDNHELKVSSSRTVIIAKELTRKHLFDAMKNRRLYSTDTSTIKIVFKCNDQWMGSTITTDYANCIVHVNDVDLINKIDIVLSSDTIYSREVNDNKYFEEFNLSTIGVDYMYVKVYSATGLSITAPIFFSSK